MLEQYKPSGKFSPISFVYFIILSLTAFPLLGLLYAYCIWHIPFIYLNIIIAGGMAFIVGLLINGIVLGKGKVRNTALATIFGILGGLITLYFHWAVWVDLAWNAGESYGTDQIGITVSNIEFLQVFGLATDPSMLFEIIKEIGEVGTWSIKGSNVSGTFLNIIWVIEALIIVVISTVVLSKARQPFCEEEEEWFEENELNAFEFIDNTDEIINGLSNIDTANLENITLAPSVEQSHSIFTLYSSKRNKNYISIENKLGKKGKDGKLEFEDEMVAEYIVINQEYKEKLLAIK